MMPKLKGFLHGLMKTFKFGSSRGEQEDLDRIAAQEQKVFAFRTLAAATKDFSEKLGEGGFGPVYKGELDDGRKIAVKKLSHSSKQGKREFTTEAKLLARVQHRNVVNLLGYCVHGDERLLVYDGGYGSDPESNRREELDWKRRFDIICGIARGLLYLHEDAPNCIIHRDIKGSNILLDDKWVPKIADFGMARLYSEEETHVNTRVAGTNGYMAPEYVLYGNLSVKSDVFSFGVVILEIVSGQRNSSFNLHSDRDNFLDWAYRLYKKGRTLEIMDPILASSAIPEQVALCIKVGLLCVQGDPHSRPTMGRVVILLSKKPNFSEEPMRPGAIRSNYKPRRPSGPSSSAGTSGGSPYRSFGSSVDTNTASASASASTSTKRAPSVDRTHLKS